MSKEKVWVQNIKGLLRGVPLADDMKAACLREFEAALSTDAEATEWQLVYADGNVSRAVYSKLEAEGYLRSSSSVIATRPLYSAPPAPAVAVKALRWKGPDSYGEYHSLDGLWGYIIRCEDDGHWLTEVGNYFPSPEAAIAAAQSDYEARIRSALA